MTLPSALEPYSTWIFSNRNVVIVFMGLVLIGVVVYSLIMNWRVESLKRDLMAEPERPERQVYSPGRASAPHHEAEPSGPAGLPPVRGGRTYARNLGSALQKSGVPPTPPIYSPPTPPGWAPNTPPGQAGRPPAPAFPGGPAPWGAPPPQSPMSWPPATTPPVQAMPPQAPTPPAPWPPFPAQSAPAAGPVMPSPAPVPTTAPPPFAAPAFPFAPTGGPAPTMAPPVGVPGGPGPFPTFVPPTPPPAPVEEPDKRGKPKRRRFSLSVFEGLEKKIQSLPGALPRVISPEAPAAPLAQPPAAPVAQAPVVPPPPPAMVPPATQPSSPLAPPAFPIAPAVGTAVPPGPSAPPQPVVPPAPAFPPPAFAESIQAKTPPTIERVPEPAVPEIADDGHDAPAEAVHPEEAPGAPSPEPQAETPALSEVPLRPKSARERRAAMRAMMFGEEPPLTSSAPMQEAPAPSAFPRYEPPAPVEVAPADPPAGEAPSAPEEPLFTFTPRAEDASPAQETVVEDAEPPTPGESPAVDEPPSFVGRPGAEVVDHEPELPVMATEPEPEPAEEPVTNEAPFSFDHPPVTVEVPAAEPAPAFHADFTEANTPEAAPNDAAEAIPPTPVEAVADGKPSAGTMVIIEDDAAVADYYATLFRGNGYRVEIAHDGVSGVDVCSKVQPDVIMLDVMMPRQNGILVLQTLRASDETKNTPVVVLSNFSEPTLIKRALQLGALEYVIKTQVEGSALLQAVPRWMNREKAFAA